MLRVGQRAPAFELPGTGGDGIETHALAEYLDREWTVVLLFYPFDFHPTCVSRLCALRDASWLTLLDDVVVLGVGTDSAYSHRRFAESEGIGFPLLSDADGRVAEAYGVLADELEGHRGVAAQALFVVDPDRTVQYAWRGAGPDDGPDFDAVEKAVRCRGDACTVPEAEAGDGADDEGDRR